MRHILFVVFLLFVLIAALPVFAQDMPIESVSRPAPVVDPSSELNIQLEDAGLAAIGGLVLYGFGLLINPLIQWARNKANLSDDVYKWLFRSTLYASSLGAVWLYYDSASADLPRASTLILKAFTVFASSQPIDAGVDYLKSKRKFNAAASTPLRE